MSAPYPGLKKVKRGHYTMEIEGIKVNFEHSNDRQLWKIYADGIGYGENVAAAIGNALPNVRAFSTAFMSIKTKCETLEGLWRPLNRIRGLLERYADSTNDPLTVEQLDAANPGSTVEMEHLNHLGDLSTWSHYTKNANGNWTATGAGQLSKRHGATPACLAEYSEFGDAKFKLAEEGQYFEMGSSYPFLKIGDRDHNVTTLIAEFAPGRDVELTFIFYDRQLNPVQCTVPPDLAGNLVLPEGTEFKETVPGMVADRLAGWVRYNRSCFSRDCNFCGKTVSTGDEYLYHLKSDRLKCMDCAVAQEDEKPKLVKAKGIDRLADAMERIANVREKEAKLMDRIDRMPPFPWRW